MTDEINKKIQGIEKAMSALDFWKDKEKAQALVKELSGLKEQRAGKPAFAKASAGKYDKGDAVLMIMAGAGGDDAEDWAGILFKMYSKFSEQKGWSVKILHKHESEHRRLPAGRQGIKNITFEVKGKFVYGTLKGESGVHRLVRISPFSAKKLRHTSFALLEVLPKFVEIGDVKIDEKDLDVSFARSSGPGGQNVNKRETAVRITHIPSGITVHVESERFQLQNKERGLELLRSKLYNCERQKQEREKKSMQKIKPGEVEWGHQIRSYIFHPYKMVKDHRTGAETSNVDAVLGGDLDKFIEAEKKYGLF